MLALTGIVRGTEQLALFGASAAKSEDGANEPAPPILSMYEARLPLERLLIELRRWVSAKLVPVPDSSRVRLPKELSLIDNVALRNLLRWG